jgi:hypothetical protein
LLDTKPALDEAREEALDADRKSSRFPSESSTDGLGLNAPRAGLERAGALRLAVAGLVGFLNTESLTCLERFGRAPGAGRDTAAGLAGLVAAGSANNADLGSGSLEGRGMPDGLGSLDVD